MVEDEDNIEAIIVGGGRDTNQDTKEAFHPKMIFLHGGRFHWDIDCNERSYETSRDTPYYIDSHKSAESWTSGNEKREMRTMVIVYVQW